MCSDTEFLVDAGGYLTALVRRELSGHLDYSERNLIEKLFQTVTMRIDRFHSFWRGSAASAGVVCERVELLEHPPESTKNSRRGSLVKHLTGGELDQAIADAQKADKTDLVRRLCYVKKLYHGDKCEEAGDRVGISRSTTHRWARAWNEAGSESLRPGFGSGRPPKLTNEQFDELYAILKEGQPWTPQAIHILIE